MTKTRKTNTKTEIVEALVALINEKGFQNINVTDITRRAGIGRGTFYTHYLDKYDLLNRIENKLLDMLRSDLKELTPSAMRWIIDDDFGQSPYPFITKTLENFNVNRDLIAALLSENGDPYFLGKVKKIILHDLNTALEKMKGQIRVSDGIPEDYARSYVIDELMGIIVYWVTKKDPEPVSEVADIVVKLQNVAPIKVFTLNNEEGLNE